MKPTPYRKVGVGDVTIEMDIRPILSNGNSLQGATP